MKLDLLTDKVNIVSPHKSLANSNLDPTNLDLVPDFVLPHYKSRKTPIITESLIPEGKRNDTLFKWVNNCNLSYHHKIGLSKCLGTYFCEVPLDVDECVNLVKTGDSEDNGDESLCSNKKIADILIHDTQVVVESMRGKYLFDPSCSNWYKWQESYWSEIPSNKLVMEVADLLLPHRKRKILTFLLLLLAKKLLITLNLK